MSPDADNPDRLVRLQKILAAAGLGSRRSCEDYVREGRVTIDGETASDLGVRVDPARQKIQVDGERIKPQKKKYYLLNKPPGYVCTNRDPLGRPLAVDLVPQDGTRLFTVGRLDESSRGLILVTNDGDLAHRMAHPRFSIPRRYQVQVAGKPAPETLQLLRDGIHFADGRFSVSRVSVVRSQGKSTILELELHQGRNREIRRLLARVGHKVMSLERVTFGALKLGRLTIGKYRPLREDELDALRELASVGATGQREGRGQRSAARGQGKKTPKQKGQRDKRAKGKAAEAKATTGRADGTKPTKEQRSQTGRDGTGSKPTSRKPAAPKKRTSSDSRKPLKKRSVKSRKR